MAHVYGHKHVKAWHTNIPMYVLDESHRSLSNASLFRAGLPPITSPFRLIYALLTMWSSESQAHLKITQKYIRDGSRYFAIQSTRPQTLAYSLADSPVGLLAWVYEKLVAWTDGYPWTDDEGILQSICTLGISSHH